MNKFITGAGSGIGAGVAKAALKAGDRVVATSRNIDKLRKALGGHGNQNLAFVQLDVVNEGQAKAAVEQAVQRFGRIDVLVNNAGFSLLGRFEELTIPAFERPVRDQLLGRRLCHARDPACDAQATVRPYHQHQLRRRCCGPEALQRLWRDEVRGRRPVACGGD